MTNDGGENIKAVISRPFSYHACRAEGRRSVFVFVSAKTEEGREREIEKRRREKQAQDAKEKQKRARDREHGNMKRIRGPPSITGQACRFRCCDRVDRKSCSPVYHTSIISNVNPSRFCRKKARKDREGRKK